MKTKRIILQVACTVAGIGAFSSCEKNSVIEPAPTAGTMKPEVVLKDGVLVFKSRKDMKNYASYLNARGVEYADKWEKSLGFKSMAHILAEVREAEDKLEVEVLQGKSDAELAILKAGPVPHSAQYTKWVNAGTLRVTKDADGAETLDVNASHSLFTNVLNAEGIVAFGDTVYQFKGDAMKVTTNGLSDLAALRTSEKSNSSRHITVQRPFTGEQPNKALKGGLNANPVISDLVISNGNQQEAQNQYEVGGTPRKITMKVSLYSELYDVPNPSNNDVVYFRNNVDFWFEAKSEYKNFWGNWKLQEIGKGFNSVIANYRWSAFVQKFLYSNYDVISVPGYTSGAANPDLSYLAQAKPNVARFDRNFGAPQFGNQIAPNGIYGPFSTDNGAGAGYITRGLLLDTGSSFSATADGRTAQVIWHQ